MRERSVDFSSSYFFSKKYLIKREDLFRKRLEFLKTRMIGDKKFFGKNKLKLLSLTNVFLITNLFISLYADELNLDKRNYLELKVPFLQREIVVDGRIEEGEWVGCFLSEKFFQVQPGNNIEPSRKTRLMMFHNGCSLFIGVDCFDENPQRIERKRARRDQFVQTDRISIVFDPFCNAKLGYFFVVYALNDIADGTIVPGSGKASVDFNFNFKSKTTIDQSGWHLEVEIPFDSVAIPKKNNQNWYFYFSRVVCRDDLIEEISLCPVDRNANNPLEGYVVLNFDNIAPGKGKQLELIPDFFVNAEKKEIDNSVNDEEVKPEIGISGNYKFSSDSIFKFSVNPDFSQIEADYLYSRINNRYPVYISEKRPFFLDGMESFNTPFTVLYTRKIVDPFLGIKFSLKKDKYGLHLLSSMEKMVPLSRFGRNENEKGNIYWNVLRFVLPSGKTSSYLGGIISLRNNQNDFNYVLDLDGVQYFQRFTLKYQLLYSMTREREKQSNGNGGYFSLDYKWNRFFTSKAALAFLSPSYRCDSGFISLNNYKMIETEIMFNYKPEKESSFLKSCEIDLDFYQMVDYSGSNIEKTISSSGSAVFPYKLSLNWTVDLSREGFLGKDYQVRNFSSEINYGGLKGFQPFVSGTLGRKIVYNPLNVRTADFKRAGTGFNIFIQNSALRNNIFFEEYRELENGHFIASQLAVQSIFYYFLSNSINIRLMLQYNLTKLLDYNYKNSYLFYNFLLTYQKSAYTALYFGVSNQRNVDYFRDELSDFFKKESFTKDLNLFLKVQYAFKL